MGSRKVGEITARRCGKSKVIIVLTQITSIAINNVSHPTPSGAPRIPILVLVAAAKGVGGCCVVAMARSFVGTGRACVVFAHAMAVSPAVVPGAGFPCRRNTRWSCRRSCRLSTAPTRSRRWSTAPTSRRINHFFVGCCEQRDGGR